MKLIEKVKITGKLKVLTGLHIGGSKENAEIGGVDTPVIRRHDNVPYIPGSSLKGKIRSLLEQSKGATKVGGNIDVNKLFGITGDDDHQLPSRIIVRDAYMTKESEDLLFSNLNTDMPFTEIKFENTIDRIKGKAEHPRQIERVPAGTLFNVEFILNVFEGGNEKSKQEQLDLLNKGIKLLENDYLGGNGTRGYGQVTIALNDPESVYKNEG